MAGGYPLTGSGTGELGVAAGCKITSYGLRVQQGLQPVTAERLFSLSFETATRTVKPATCFDLSQTRNRFRSCIM